MVLNRDQELWAGTAYIAQQIQRLSNEGDEAGIATWKTVAERFDQLSCQSPTS